MKRQEFFGALVRVAIFVCGLLAGQASWWAAVDRPHHPLLPIFLWMGVAFAWCALIPVVDRPWQTPDEVTV